ncbi:bifunctional 2-polyprenyl-6-hydroxyphenol methylase/3-demethylubiquinol 3-O-methyltransferase UbiG [Sinomonas sp. R1AF57]|uniref:class I SAM-dependent methyltransferase n=1 Tax=Sinomonas sp. R1AF57 TaxID=2020377 RepID=UPI000B6020DE|nr:class I SAM-dependent methyltransferase [Sinomonas sp. R1AF57]ASN51224.1 SAM-dependent methyltransferase [Sinomonas sp. R1AF57]
MRAFYNLWYRRGTPPWVGPARVELVQLVESGRIPPGRSLDLGCGEGDNSVFLARHGFEATGVDFAPAALAKARSKAEAAGVVVRFIEDDLTTMRRVSGPFDVLVDYGSFDDLHGRDREAYVRAVVPLLRAGGLFLLWCFEWVPSLWERAAVAALPFGDMALRPGEVEDRFGRDFSIERIAGESGLKGWPHGWAAYLMTRR